jgi:hypothetical protein
VCDRGPGAQARWVGQLRQGRLAGQTLVLPVQLIKHLGEDDAAVERQLLHEYAEVAPAVPLLHAPTSRMTLRIAVDSLVLYRSLPTDLSPRRSGTQSSW